MSNTLPATPWTADLIAFGLRECLESPVSRDCVPAEVRNVQSFQEAGMLPGCEGLVLTMYDGTEFRVTVVRSR